MYYRVTKINFDADRFDEIVAWGETKRAAIEGIKGLGHVDVFRSEPGEGMIVTAYESEAAYTAASETVTAVLGEMAQFMTATPHTHSGTWTSPSVDELTGTQASPYRDPHHWGPPLRPIRLAHMCRYAPVVFIDAVI